MPLKYLILIKYLTYQPIYHIIDPDVMAYFLTESELFTK